MLSFYLAVAAVQAPLVDEPIEAREVVVTATGAEQERDTTGQAVTVITRADLETRQTVSLADFLATTPGVTVTRNGGPGNFTAVRIRGAEAEQTLTLIDGVRVNDPSSPGGGFDFGNLLAGSIDRVEVLRGANSVAWGSRAIGGIVNVVTAQPRAGVTARAQREYGYHDSGYATAALAAGSERVRGSVTGGYLTTDGISTAAVGTERDGYRQYGGTAKLVVEPVDGIGVDARVYYADSRLDLDGFPPPAFGFTDTAEYSRSKELYGYAGVFADLADGRFRNRAALTIADIDRDNYDPAAGPSPSFQARGRSERYEYRGDLRIIDAIRVIGGAEHEDSRFNDRAGTKASTGITSFYGQAVVMPLARVTLTGGVRHDDHADFGSRTTFGGNAAIGVGSGTVVRANYAEGFKAPTLFQLFAAFFGTPTLRPELAKSYDVGVEQTLGRATLALTYFRRRTRNQIDFDLGTFTYANIARTRAEGVEAEATLRPTERLSFALNYSHIATENRSAGTALGNDLARRPRDTANVSADWRSPFGVAVGGTLSLVGDSFDNAANTNRLDGYVLAGVRAELPFGERFAVFGRVDNAFDANYRTVAGYGTYGRSAFVGLRARLK
ncbi:MAG: TonB-dependent receptor [Pseudomonadota bacterium]